MPRPKGSKNKKTLEEEARIGERIAEKLMTKKRLEKEQERIQKEIDERNEQLKALRTEMRRNNRAMEALIAKRDELDAAAEEVAKIQEVEARVAHLIGTGVTADELLTLLQL